MKNDLNTKSFRSSKSSVPYCSDGKLRGQQTLEGSGKWRLDKEQFMGKPNWDKFIEKRARIKEQSFNIANNMLDNLDDVE